MAFGAFEAINVGTVYQQGNDSLVIAVAEALGAGATAFSLLGEVSLDGGATFMTVAAAWVSDFDPPNIQGARRQSLSMPVPAGVHFRLRVETLASPAAVVRAWVMKVS